MKPDRIIYAVLMGLTTAAAMAAQVDGVNAKLVMWCAVGAAGVNGVLRILWPAPPGAP
jgi:hypothetical protein